MRNKHLIFIIELLKFKSRLEYFKINLYERCQSSHRTDNVQCLYFEIKMFS